MSQLLINHPNGLTCFEVPASEWTDPPYASDYLPPACRDTWSEADQREFDAFVDKVLASISSFDGIRPCGFGFDWRGEMWYMNIARKAAVTHAEAIRLRWTEEPW